jgi:hypothetical protein
MNTNKKVVRKESDDALSALGGLGQEEFWKESLDPSEAEVHFRKLLLPRLGVNSTPLFLALRHLLSSCTPSASTCSAKTIPFNDRSKNCC